MARMWPLTSRAATARAAAPGPHTISRTRECGSKGSAFTIAARRRDRPAGTSARAIQEFLGHSDLKTTQIYSHYARSGLEIDIVDASATGFAYWPLPAGGSRESGSVAAPASSSSICRSEVARIASSGARSSKMNISTTTSGSNITCDW